MLTQDAFLRGTILGALLVIVVLAVGVAIKIHDDTVVNSINTAIYGYCSKGVSR